ncbi:MAG: hypothetical protein HY269_09485, partial [Deltaproteobacteria bacterium]|nr:hypothetical protein [Deltaproteobacteria bacterium]
MALVAVFGMYAAFLFIGVRAARKVKAGTTADLLVAGRAMPLWLATLTMTATWVDGGYLLGTVEGTYKTSVTSGAQGGLCFGLSLILGGLFFARRMRQLEFTTLIDPFEARFGKRWAAVLFLPALLGEVFWSAELLVALPIVFAATGGLSGAWAGYVAARPDRVGLLPPLHSTGFWTTQTIVNWWDVSVMLVLGGIPWNCYFQRVLSCQTPRKAV